MGRIVVGVDGSEESKAALGWGLEEAVVRSASVEVVYVYQFTPEWQLYGYAGATSEERQRELEEQQRDEEREAAEQATELVRGLLEEVGVPDGVDVEIVPVPDRRPAEALIERARGAELLVVGSRGRGGFAGLLLGSVSHQVATHATCPVVIITPHARED